MKTTITLLSIVLGLTACVQPPKPLRGEFSAVSPRQVQNAERLNQKIRWTGFVLEVENLEKKSCLTVVGKIPDAVAKPSRYYRADQGRFIACKEGFLEPEFFNEKPITVTGVVREVIEKKVGEHPYRYPVVDASVVYVW
ncbi:Slp family lipoprotein [Marinicella sp. W31]|uniref:Slp family lipoprotein n=1 Tax=Marinicella sp. W31 TaxID=3023713 RepID=UPI0037571DEE